MGARGLRKAYVAVATLGEMDQCAGRVISSHRSFEVAQRAARRAALRAQREGSELPTSVVITAGRPVGDVVRSYDCLPYTPREAVALGRDGFAPARGVPRPASTKGRVFDDAIAELRRTVARQRHKNLTVGETVPLRRTQR